MTLQGVYNDWEHYEYEQERILQVWLKNRKVIREYRKEHI